MLLKELLATCGSFRQAPAVSLGQEKGKDSWELDVFWVPLASEKECVAKTVANHKSRSDKKRRTFDFPFIEKINLDTCCKKKKDMRLLLGILYFLFVHCDSEGFTAAVAKTDCEFCSFSFFVWSARHFPGFCRFYFFSTLRTYAFCHFFVSLSEDGTDG